MLKMRIALWLIKHMPSPAAAGFVIAGILLAPSLAFMERAYADARVQRIYGGTTEIMKEIIGRSLGV